MKKKSTTEELAEEANRWHQKVKGAMSDALKYAKKAGAALNRAKQEERKALKEEGKPTKGYWEKWLNENFTDSHETARIYMKIAREWKKIEPHLQNANMSIRRALELLRHKPERERSEDAWQPSARDLQLIEQRNEKIGRLKVILGEQAEDWSDCLLHFLSRNSGFVEECFSDMLDEIAKEMEPIAEVLISAQCEKDKHQGHLMFKKFHDLDPNNLTDRQWRIVTSSLRFHVEENPHLKDWYSRFLARREEIPTRKGVIHEKHRSPPRIHRKTLLIESEAGKISRSP